MPGKIDKAVEGLWKSPNEKSWGAFRSALKGSGIVYYRVAYQDGGKLNRIQDIKKSFVELFDSKYNLKAKVPLFMNEGKGITGATKYLIGLKVINGEM